MYSLQEVKRIEEKLGKPLREFSLKEVALTDQTIVPVKVHELINEGAKFGDPSIGRRICVVHQMDAPLKKYPKISPNAFNVYHVSEIGKAPIEAIEFDSYTLDCTGNRGYHKVNIAVSKAMVRDSQFDVIEANLKRAGEAMGWHMTEEIIDAIDANAGLTVETGSTNWDRLVQAIGEVRSAGFTPNAIVIHPQEEAKLLQLNQFITAYQLDPTGEIRRTGQIGQILGIPVYSTPKANQGYMYVLDTNNAYALGIWQDLEIENYDDPLEGLVGAVVSMRYDHTLIWSEAICKVTAV